MRKSLCLSLIILGLSACSNIPKSIQTAPTNDLQIDQIMQNSTETTSQEVRWGGTIVGVENKPEQSIVQIVQYPLNNYGRPNTNKLSPGRFLARTNQFLDPLVYKEGDLITFSGIVTGEIESRPVDKKSLSMPVIKINESYKWLPYEPNREIIYYDPFFHPYNRFYYGYPYYRMTPRGYWY